MEGVSSDIASWLSKHAKKTWHLNAAKLIDVKGNVTVMDQEIEEFPIEFGNVEGTFSVMNCYKLKSIKGFPTICEKIEIGNCYFPTDFYLKAYQQNKTIKQYIESDIANLYRQHKEIIDLNFPDFVKKHRGAIKMKKFSMF